MDESSSEDEDRGPPRKLLKPKSKKYKQNFRQEWMKDPSFQQWLLPLKHHESEPSCKVCSKKLTCSKTALQRHGESIHHKQAYANASRQVSIHTSLQNQDSANVYKEITTAQVAAFIAAHNLPLRLAPFLLDLIKARCPKNSQETNCLRKIEIGATKCTNVIRQGIGLHYAQELIDILRRMRYSIIPDETTDVSSEKQLAVCVMYVDETDLLPVTRFLDIVEVDNSGANGLYQAIRAIFQEKFIPLSNIIGYSSDTCNVMFGENLSVSTLLKKDFPHVTAVKCSCHLIHLCASHACLKLSKSLEDLCRNIYSHFSRSSLRRKDFKQFQEFVEAQPHKMLKLSQTRWLSLESCVNRILEQWEALRLYFIAFVADGKDPSYTTDSILNALNNKFVLAQLEFLSVQLKRLNEFNTMFQSTEPLLHYLREEVTKLLKDILSDFISMDVVRKEDPFTIDLDCMNIRLPLDKVYMGILATNTLFELKDDPNVQTVKKACVEFLVELVKQIRSRFDMKDPIFKLVEFLIPSNAVKCVPPSLNELFLTLPYLAEVADVTRADQEWRKQALEEPEEVAPEETSTVFLQKRLNAKTLNGTLKYPNLKKVVACVMSLPCSNASVERVFSLLKLIKTDFRNALKRETLVGLMHAHVGMKANDVHAHQLELNAEFVRVLKSVKSNATDSEAGELIRERFKKV
ncbi:zinc finger MYM-type 1-like [Paramuricea clavata]|uniref:Zinc finger MYM-type 1-like n=1 Tax=Paramuricea clavata TaxID=317549 RepID=A0A6S7L6Q6_PARCT|nr:zinc finger MYM-type 1-like [Paramuricea clavata]